MEIIQCLQITKSFTESFSCDWTQLWA